jgi:hypothetical protein
VSLRNILLSTLGAAALVAPVRLCAQTPDSGAFFVRLGKDTLAIERYVRNPHQLLAEAVLRTPQTRSMKLTVTFNDKGGVAWYEVLNSPVPGVPNSPPAIRTIVTYAGDSARVENWVAAVPRQGHSLPVTPSMIPLQPPFYSMYETALANLHKGGADTATMTMLAPSGPYSYKVHWLGGDSLSLYNVSAGTLRAHVDRAGELLSLNGQGTTFKVMVTRARWADIEAYTRRFASVDAQGKAIGVLSPRDTLDDDVGTSSIFVMYGRPSKRGRIVFGGLVPWGEVWRTGANEATQIEFGLPVHVAGVAVPAGKYTLWSIPDPKQWTIILNKQTGQWGTEYDPKRDLVRIPVKCQTLSQPVETFTMAINRLNKTQGTMTMAWDRTRVVIPISSP